MSDMSTQALGVRRRRPWWRSTPALWAYVFILPYSLLFLAFRIIPATYGLGLSFTKVKLSGDATFIGLENFKRMASDPLFWKSLSVTITYTVIAIPLTLFVSIFTASLCNRALRGISIYRAIFFLPVVTSPVIAGVIFKWLFGGSGPASALTSALGLTNGSWLGSEFWVLPALACLQAWSRFGYDMLILLAGMLAIPQEYYEAAEVDRSTPWQRFWHITLPLMRPALFFVLVLETASSFQMMDAVLVMTGGGPLHASYTTTFMVYDQAFKFSEFGYASAIGIVMLIILLAVTWVQNRVLGRSNQ